MVLQAAVCTGSGPAEGCSPQLRPYSAAAATAAADQRPATAIPGPQVKVRKPRGKLRCIQADTHVTRFSLLPRSRPKGQRCLLVCLVEAVGYRSGLFSLIVLLFVFLHRASESLLPPVTRSMSIPVSVPESIPGSVWEMQNPSSQASCTPNLQQNVPSCESPYVLSGALETEGTL